MATLVDLNAELAKTTMLRGRTPQTTRAERQGSSRKLADYRDGAIFASRFSGEGGWERHRNGDELVHILDGAATLHLMTTEGPQALALSAGMLAVVPQGTWHRVRSARWRDFDDRDAAADRSSRRPCRRPADP